VKDIWSVEIVIRMANDVSAIGFSFYPHAAYKKAYRGLDRQVGWYGINIFF